MDDSEFDLAEVIECLRQQLRESRIKGVGQTPRFLVDEAEVELKVGVTGKREGGLNFKVFGIMGLTLVFAVAQAPLMKRHQIPESGPPEPNQGP